MVGENNSNFEKHSTQGAGTEPMKHTEIDSDVKVADTVFSARCDSRKEGLPHSIGEGNSEGGCVKGGYGLHHVTLPNWLEEIFPI